jgi:hypothetical protein
MAEVKLIDRAPIKRSQWVTITLRKDAHFVNIDIYGFTFPSRSAVLIRRESLGPMRAGSHQWFWDGRNDMGELIAAGQYWITMTTDYGKITSKTATGTSEFDCITNLIREGWALVYAARKCGFELDEDVIANRHGEQDCIEQIIQRGGLEHGLESYRSAYNQCVFAEPTVTEIPPEAFGPTPGLPAPPITEPFFIPPEYDDTTGPGPPEQIKKMPGWAWGAIAFVALILLSSRRRD